MTNLEEQITRALDRRAESVVVRDDLDDVLDETTVVPFSDTTPSPRRRLSVLLVAAAGLIVVTAGLAWTQTTRNEPATTADRPSAASPTSWFADVDSLATDEWLVPASLPTGFEYQYSSLNDSPDGVRSFVSFGREPSLTGQLTVTVRPDPWPATGGDTVDVLGRDWIVSDREGAVVGTTTIGPRYAEVAGPVSRNELIDVLRSLAVVPQAQLPSAPLTFAEVMNDVGVFDVNGEQVTMSVNESNGWFCVSTRSETGGGGGCASYFDPAEKISRYHGGSSKYDESQSQRRLALHGMSSADVTRIEVDFINGGAASVVPQNTSGLFSDTRFWTAGATVDIEPGQDPDTLTNLYVEIRAYGSDGTLLATRTPEDDFLR